MRSIMKAPTAIFLATLVLDVNVVCRPDHNIFDPGHFNHDEIITRDICIVGGGSAGTYAAIQLHDMGKSVVVVEKQDRLGGHTDTYVDKTTGEAINVGVQLFHNLTIVSDYFNRLGVPLLDFPSTPSNTIYLDFDTGKSVPGYTPASATAVEQAFQIYGEILATKYSFLEAGYYLPDPVPPELLIPFEEFATKYGLEAIAPLMNLYNQNNGELWKQTTLYVIKAFGLALLQSFQQGFVTTHNVDDLYKSAASILAGNVLYDATIVAMDRDSSDGVQLIVNTPGGKKLVKANKIIMTGPPMTNNLEGWDLSRAEEQVFERFSALGYFAGVISNTGIPQTVLENVGKNNPFNLNSLPGCFSINPTNLPNQHLVYYGTNAPVSDSGAQDGIVDQINRLASHHNFPAAETTFLYTTNHSPYRLYVSADDIKNGFYKNLYALQGTKNTFWSGAAWMTHDSSLVWTFTEALLPRVIS